MQWVGPYGTTDLVSLLAELTRGAHGRPHGYPIFKAPPMRCRSPHALQVMRPTSHAVKHQRLLTGCGFGLQLPHEDAHEDADVEIGADGQQGGDGAAVAAGAELQGVQHDAQCHLVAEPPLDGHGPVFAIARLRAVPSQHRRVGARHAQQPAVAQRLHGRVQEGGGAAVRIQIDGVKQRPLRGAAVQQEGGVLLVRLHDPPRPVAAHTAL